MLESRYTYNSAALALEHYSQEPADYDLNTYQKKEVFLAGLSGCKFSYSDGLTWHAAWPEEKERIPRAIKVNFKFQDEDKEREFIVNIPVSL